jgi:hypothetical protein
MSVEIEEAELEDEWNFDDAQDDILDRSAPPASIHDMAELERRFLGVRACVHTAAPATTTLADFSTVILP